MLFDLMLENLGLRDLNPLICGHEDCAPGHCYGPAVRGYTLLHYVLSGCGVFETGGKRYPVHKGQIFVIHPREVTTYVADSVTPWHYCWVGFELGFALPAPLDCPVITAHHCDYIFRSLCFQRNTVENPEWYVAGRVYELLSLLSVQDDTGRSSAQRYVQRAKNYMDSCYMEDISVERIAARLGLNRSYFCRIFRAVLEVTPSSYLLNLRLESAAELIRAGCAPWEAAQGCGYGDTASFSRIFKKRFGVAPSIYRRQNAPEHFPEPPI
ncbi:MAG: AraC family transcriptional regulator [Angelakisella sp.]